MQFVAGSGPLYFWLGVVYHFSSTCRLVSTVNKSKLLHHFLLLWSWRQSLTLCQNDFGLYLHMCFVINRRDGMTTRHVLLPSQRRWNRSSGSLLWWHHETSALINVYHVLVILGFSGRMKYKGGSIVGLDTLPLKNL